MPRVLVFFGIALLGVSLFTALTVWTRWDKHLELTGRVTKVRTVAPTPEDSVMVLDLKLENPSELPYEVDEIELRLTPAKGEPVDGVIVAAQDVQRVFDAYPQLGLRGNDPLRRRDIIGGHKTLERMLAFQFPGTKEQVLLERKALVLKVRERQGAVHEIR